MNTLHQYKTVRLIGVLSVFLIIAYILPIIPFFKSLNIALFTNDEDGLNESWIRSIIFALSSTCFNVLISLGLATGLQSIKITTNKGKWLAFLLIPVLLGNVSVAFIGKLLFADASFFHQNASNKLITLGLIQFWQFGTMNIYLFWLVIQNIPDATWNYIDATKANWSEKLKDIVLPACRNLTILLFILNFVFTIYEDAKIELIFKASRGTHTELISQWLNRNYQSASLLNINIAVQTTLQVGLIILAIGLVIVLLTTFIFNKAYLSLIQSRRNLIVFHTQTLQGIIWWGLFLFISLPFLYVIAHSLTNLNLELSHLLFPLGFTSLAALFSTLFAVLLSTFWRLGWQNILYSFNNKSIILFISLFILQLLPPILLLITGFQWLKIIGYQSTYSLYIVWVLGHTILILPILSSFLTVTHFRVENKELNYLQAYQISLTEIIKTSFIKRFIADYLLTFLFAFSLIWNESIINNLLSDFIPSFVSEMKMSITGRSTDYAKGISYLLVSFAITMTAIIVWKNILDKNTKQNT